MADLPRRAMRASTPRPALVADGLRVAIAVERMTEAVLAALLIPTRLRVPDCG